MSIGYFGQVLRCLHRSLLPRRFAFGWEAAGPRSPAGWKVKLKDRDAERARFDFLGQAIAQKVQAMLEAILADARSATPADGEPWLEASLDDAQSSTAAHGESLLWPVDELLLRWGETVQEGLEERGEPAGKRRRQRHEKRGAR